MLFNFFKKNCPSNRDHKVRGQILTNKFGDKYCSDPSCIEANTELCISKTLKSYSSVSVDYNQGVQRVYGDIDSISRVVFRLAELEYLKRDKDLIQNNYNNYKAGIEMSNKATVDLLIEAHTHLVVAVNALGVIEPRIPGFIDWFERVRDQKMGAQSDIQTYKLCKTIANIEAHVTLLNSEA